MPEAEKQNLTVSLTKLTIRRAKILAARRSTSISGLLEAQIEALVGQEEAYQRSLRQALNLMDRGFRLDTAHRVSREALHER